MPFVVFTLLLAAASVVGALLQPAPLIGAFAAWLTWNAAVALSLAGKPSGRLARVHAFILPAGAFAALVFAARAIAAARSPEFQLFSASALRPFLLLAAFVGFFLQTYAGLRARDASALNWSAALTAAALKLNTALFAVTAALLFAERQLDLRLQTPWTWLVVSLTAIWILDTAARSIGRLYLPPRFARVRPPVVGAWLLLPFLTPAARARFRASPEADAPVIALADMWFLPTLRRLALPLVALAALLAWGSTAFHEIPVGSVGLWSRFGRVHDVPLAAGFKATLPYPFHEVTVLAAERLQRVVLGLEADTGQPILWDRAHYVGEQNQLVGRGDDLLTISVPIYFYVRDPLAFHRHTLDPAQTIRDLAAQQLLAHTLQRSAFDIMTTQRGALAESLRRDVQAALDRRDSGLAVALVCFRDIHPPVQVGPAYQEVVSALEDREAYRHEGEDYRAENFPRARSDAQKTRATAEADATARTARVRGETARFEALLASYQDNREVFRVRQSFAAFDESLRGVKKLLVDEKFRGRLPTFVDVRKTLNPDFAPELAPETPSLIPTLAGKRSDFDRSVDGYLRAGQGAIPATSAQAADPDNLLTPKP
jgi:regulator of protease activity HflC (stomatin/prohibitin superfamily)